MEEPDMIFVSPTFGIDNEGTMFHPYRNLGIALAMVRSKYTVIFLMNGEISFDME